MIVNESSSDNNEAEERELAKAIESDSDEASLEEIESEEVVYTTNVKPGNHVLVAVHGKRSTKHFVGQVTSVSNEDDLVEVDFLVHKGEHFCQPETGDSASVDINDVKLVLPPPTICGGTKRTSKNLTFAIDLTKFFV